MQAEPQLSKRSEGMQTIISMHTCAQYMYFTQDSHCLVQEEVIETALERKVSTN